MRKGTLGQVWYLIVSIPDLCTLTYFYNTPDRQQSKTLILSTNVETEFSIAICRQIGDKWQQIGDKVQTKALFLAVFDSSSSIVKSVFDCRSPVCITPMQSC